MTIGEWLYWFCLLASIIYPIWWIVSVYNRRVKEIEKLREDVEELKRDRIEELMKKRAEKDQRSD